MFCCMTRITFDLSIHQLVDTPGWLLVFGYYEKCCCKQSCPSLQLAGVSVNAAWVKLVVNIVLPDKINL